MKAPLLVTEDAGFQQFSGIAAQLTVMKDVSWSGYAAVHKTGEGFLSSPALSSNQNGGIGTCDLLGELDDFRHRVIAVDEIAEIVGDCSEHRGDQVGSGGNGMYFWPRRGSR